MRNIINPTGWGKAVLLAPAVVIFLVFVVGAGILMLFYSMTNWRGYGPIGEIVWFENYWRLLASNVFLRSLNLSLIFTIFYVLITNSLALVLALLIASPTAENRVLRALYFMPSILPAVAVGFIWRRLFEPGGLVPVALEILGIDARFLSDNTLAMSAVIWTAVWQTTGVITILFVARIITIPRDLFEAAALDGATHFQRARLITLPLLLPTLFVTLVFTTVTGLREFDRPIALTGGGPARATEMVAMRIIDDAFQRGNFGLASAAAVVLMTLTAVVALVIFRIGKKLEVQQ